MRETAANPGGRKINALKFQGVFLARMFSKPLVLKISGAESGA